ncbi:hypothetical protein ACQPW3_31470 [Actinosynnema sp. CA-248983]
MTYPDSGRPENQPSFPVPEPYRLHPDQVAQVQPNQPATPAGGFAPPTPPGGEPVINQAAVGQTAFTPTGVTPTSFEPTGFEPPARGTPASAPRKKTGLIVLSIIAVLFFATAGVFGILFADESSRNDRLTADVAAKEKQVSDSAKQLKDAQDETAKAKDAQKAAETARKRAEDDSASVAKCRDAARALREAFIADDDPKIDQAFRDLFSIC